MSVIKKYENIGNGTTLAKAIVDRNGQSNLFDNLVQEQQEHYMNKERDYSRITTIVWDLKDQNLIDLFTRWKIKLDEVDLDETHDRNWLNKLSRRKMTFQEQKAMAGLIKAFNTDLENTRGNWGYDLAWDDFNIQWDNEIDKDNDQEVVDFLGLNKIPEIIGFIIDGNEHDLSETEYCIECKEPTVIAEMKQEWENDDDEPFKESHYYCQHCGKYYKYNFKHCKLNPHINGKIILARLV